MKREAKHLRGSIYDHPQRLARYASMAASRDPEEYRQIGGEARRRVVGIRFVCGGCGAYVGRVELLNDTALIAALTTPNVPVVADEEHEHYTVTDEAGAVTKEWWPCPRGCVSAAGERRGVQLTVATATAWLDDLAVEAGPNTRLIVTRRF